MKLVLFRHGKSFFDLKDNQEKLTQKGKTQVIESSNELRNCSYSKVYTGSLGRTRESGIIIAKNLNLPIFSDPRLDEISRGIFNELPINTFYEEWSKYDFSLDYIPQGGESINNARRRIFGFLEETLNFNDESGAILVTHKGVIANILMNLYNFEYKEANLNYGEYTILSLIDKTVTLDKFKDLKPLTKDWRIKI
ncbi:MAG: histidine phosphatase family protein [archaeon]|nr:histidine phosphatase family protein [archaeon]